MAIKTTDNIELRERVARAKEQLLSAPPSIDTDRIRILLEVYQETEGQPAVWRRAKAFYRLCLEKPILLDDNPIAGTLTKYAYGSYPLPEIGCRWMRKVGKLRLPLGEATLTEGDKEWIHKAADYWKDSNVYNRTQELMLQCYGADINQLQKLGIGTEYSPGGLMDVVPDYTEVLSKGFEGILADIEGAKSKLDVGDSENLAKWYFHNATALCLKGIIELAQRYARAARDKAREEGDPARKAGLVEIAEICERVPAKPARTFREALQSVWFVMMGGFFENPTTGNPTPARFPYYMYPFYARDREQGKIDDEQTIDLIQFYFLKLQGMGQVLSPFGFEYSQSRSALNLSIGGLTPEGKDATTQLDWLVLEAKRRLMTPEPLICLLYHDRLSDEFLMKCVELIKTGIGQPSFVDVRKSMQRNLYLHKGITLPEARDNAVVPCVNTIVPGYSDNYWEGHFNAAKLLELALNGGKDPLTGTQIGPQNGGIESFKTYADLHEAVLEQARYFIPISRNAGRIAWTIVKEFPVPFASAVVHDCIQKGKDLSDGGARYYAGVGLIFVGVIDLANSMGAIKQLVFDDRKITLARLKDALDANFEKHEEILRMCLDAPKYGNGDEETDSIAEGLYRILGQEAKRLPDFLGREVQPQAVSVATHGGRGQLTGALPNGRGARVALTDGTISAQPGTDRNGPTALFASAARVIDVVEYGCSHLNMKFHPSSLRSAEQARKFISLIKTYMDLGGYHVQFNVVSAETLKDARAHPEKHRNLVVRVAGFSAYFVTLDPIIQEEIIRRTELSIS